MQNSIRIIATPPGQAPDHIRMQWVGVVIPLANNDAVGIQVGVRGGAPENGDGYKVNSRDAVECLRKKSPEAADWWDNNFPVDRAQSFVFRKDVCELVE